VKRLLKKDIQEIKRRFLEHYPDNKSELNYDNIYQLCVAVMLSAQCTDKRVNIITPNFFTTYPDTKTLAKAEIEDIKELIKTCSYFNNKAKNLSGFAKTVEDRFGGEIPRDRDLLIELPGIGRKSANVITIESMCANYMAVDTHVFRVSHRLGLSAAKTATETEKDLSKKFVTELHKLHQAFVLFGRYICKSKKPECERCFLIEFCKSKEGFKPK